MGIGNGSLRISKNNITPDNIFNMIRKTIWILMLTTVVFCGHAQTETADWQQQRHDLQVGIGTPFIAGLYVGNYLLSTGFGPMWWNPSEQAGYWLGRDVYRGTAFVTPTLSVSYRYQVARWCKVGITLSYAGTYAAVFDRVTNENVGRVDDHLISIMPTVQFPWLHRKYVELYSGVSVGYSFSTGPYYDQMIQKDRYYTQHYLGFQVTAIGVKAGKKWYGFAELGVGVQGCLSAGFGYRFNNNSNN